MIRRMAVLSCTLIAVAWASLGVAPASSHPVVRSAHAAVASPVRAAAVVGIGVLSATAAVGFGRDRRRRCDHTTG